MVSKLIFLGTAGDSFVVSKQVRTSGGLIIQTGDTQLHIDPGQGTLASAAEYKVNLRANTAVLVSNNNLLHCNDVNAVIDAMTYGGLDVGGVLIGSKTVLEGTEDVHPYITKLHKGFVEKVMPLEAGQKVGIEDIDIYAMSTNADDSKGIGFKIVTNDFILGYSSDTKYSKDIAKSYRGCDIMILHVPYPDKIKEGNHLCSKDAVSFIKEVMPRLVIITHFGIDMIKADPLNQARQIQKESGVKVVLAKDGMSVLPDSYSAESRQKRLSMFKDQDTGVITTEENEEVLD